MKAKLVVFGISLLLLSACATAYAPSGWQGGFSSVQIDQNVFKVSFKGNSATSRERAKDFNLLRCADISLENGFSYFVIVGSEHDSRISKYTTPTRSETNVNVTGYGKSAYGTATTTTYAGQTYFFESPSNENTIICYKEKPEGFSYNANLLSKSIRVKYNIQ